MSYMPCAWSSAQGIISPIEVWIEFIWQLALKVCFIEMPHPLLPSFVLHWDDDHFSVAQGYQHTPEESYGTGWGWVGVGVR